MCNKCNSCNSCCRSPKLPCVTNSNQVLITDSLGNVMWTDQCSFNGLSQNQIGTATVTASLVLKKVSATSSCLQTLQPSGPNQMLLTDSFGNLTFQDQCSFQSMNVTVTLQTVNTAVGVIINTGGTTNGCFRTLRPTDVSQVLVTTGSNTMTWIPQSSLPFVSSVGTSDGLTVNGVAGGTITSTGVLGLDGWEIVTGSKILRPKFQSGTVNQGKLGDSTHIINELNLNNLILYNNTTKGHLIQTSALVPYTWTTPTSNPPLYTSLIQVDTSGNVTYIPSTTSTQVLVSTGNTPTWIEQCSFNGLSTKVASVPYSLAVYGAVINNGASSLCLNTVTPGLTALTAASKALVTDVAGNITWILQSAFPFVSSVGTSDGLTVGGVAGGTITSTGTLGLDGWEIVTGSKILRPKTQSGTLTQGRLGDSTHIIADMSINNVILYNSALTFAHTISSGATANYTWTTPSANPATTTSVLTVNTSGTIIYSAATTGTQFLTSEGVGNAQTWTEQCDIGFININQLDPTTVPLNVDYAAKRSGVLVRVEAPTNNSLCLWDIQPTLNAGINQSNQTLVTDNSGNVTWSDSLVNTISVFPDGVIKDNVVSVASLDRIVNGFGNEGEEIVTIDELPSNGSLRIHNPYTKDIIFIQTTPRSNKIFMNLVYYGNGYDRAVLLGNKIQITSDAGTFVLGSDQTSATYTIGLVYVTGVAPNFNVNCDIYTVTAHVISFVGTTSIAFVTVAGSPTPGVDQALTSDITYNREYITVGCFYNGSAYVGAFQLTGAIFTNPTPVQTIAFNLGLHPELTVGTGNYMVSVRSDTNMYSLAMTIAIGAASGKDNLLSLFYNTTTNVFSSNGDNVAAPTNILATSADVFSVTLLPMWSKTAAVSQKFLYVENSTSDRILYEAVLTLDSTALTIATALEGFLYPTFVPTTDYITNRTFTSNFEIGPTVGGLSSFALTYRSLSNYNESPLITVPYNFNWTTNIITLGADDITKDTNGLSGKTDSFFDTPLFQAVYTAVGSNTNFIAAALTSSDLIILIGTIIESPVESYTSVVAYSFVTASPAMLVYRHRGQLPLGVSRATAVVGTADVTIQGFHSLTVPPPVAYEVLWAHGNGQLARTRRVNLNLPYPSYVPVARFGIYRNGKLYVF